MLLMEMAFGHEEVNKSAYSNLISFEVYHGNSD